MSYCRFENTLQDLLECQDALSRMDFASQRELDKAKHLIEVCQEIAHVYDDVNDLRLEDDED